jgi:hypothetical protein
MAKSSLLPTQEAGLILKRYRAIVPVFHSSQVSELQGPRS